MKQLIPLFLFLLPCFALAQYPTNGNQKITLGEQTSADGLVYRGVLADTGIITPSSDTSAYIILDTVNHRFYNYNRATNVWSMAGVGSISSGLTGVLPVANGGTGASSFSPNNYLIRTNSSGIFDTSVIYEASGNVGYGVIPSDWGTSTIGTNTKILEISQKGTFLGAGAGGLLMGSNMYGNNVSYLYARTGLGSTIYTINTSARSHTWSQAPVGTAGDPITFTDVMSLNTSGNLGLGVTSPTEKLHVVGNGRFTAVGAGTFSNNLNITSTGVLTTATSDEKFKYNIRPLNYGLETLLQLKPVNFQWIEGEEEDLGFIAQDVADIIPEAVNTNWSSDLLFRYESLIPILTKAIQEQQAQIETLKQRLLILENK